MGAQQKNKLSSSQTPHKVSVHCAHVYLRWFLPTEDPSFGPCAGADLREGSKGGFPNSHLRNFVRLRCKMVLFLTNFRTGHVLKDSHNSVNSYFWLSVREGCLV